MEFISKTYRTSYTWVAYNMQNVIGQCKHDGVPVHTTEKSILRSPDLATESNQNKMKFSIIGKEPNLPSRFIRRDLSGAQQLAGTNKPARSPSPPWACRASVPAGAAVVASVAGRLPLPRLIRRARVLPGSTELVTVSRHWINVSSRLIPVRLCSDSIVPWPGGNFLRAPPVMAAECNLHPRGSIESTSAIKSNLQVVVGDIFL
jgi:hypothetical protein